MSVSYVAIIACGDVGCSFSELGGGVFVDIDGWRVAHLAEGYRRNCVKTEGILWMRLLRMLSSIFAEYVEFISIHR